MAELSRTYDPADGPILNVSISDAGSAHSIVIPLLVDTGADGTSVATDVARNLSLISRGRRTISTSIGGRTWIDTYLVDFGIPFDDGTTHWERKILVGEFLFSKPSIRGVIGRDILCKGVFTMRPDHRFTFEL